MEKIIEGRCERMFCVINTTEYNGDGKYSVQVVSQNELADVGFVDGLRSHIIMNGIDIIGQMEVTDVANTDWSGCLLIRIA